MMKTNIFSKSRVLTGLGFLIIAMAITYGCSKSSMSNMTGTGGTGYNSGSGTPGANEVFIQGMAFSPASITVKAGTTITWTNKDAVTHNVTSSPALFSSGSLGTGATYSYTFNDMGTFSYTCTIHPSMKGTVVVN